MTEDNILLSFAHDRMSKCINEYVITSTSFLDVRQQSLVLSEFSKFNEAKTILYGGYDDAEHHGLKTIRHMRMVQNFGVSEMAASH